MKKCVSFGTIIAFMTALCIPAAATDYEMNVAPFSVSEYEMVLSEHQEWVEEQACIIADDADNVEVSSDPLEDYKERLDERAGLPEDVLSGYGYSGEQIEILKQYENGEISFETAARATSANLSGSLYCGTHTKKKYAVTYNWTWDVLPNGLGQDGFGLGLYGVADDSRGFDTRMESTAASVTYYYTTGTRYRSESVSKTPNTNMLTAVFDSYKLSDAGDRWVWAKEGYMTIVIVPTVPGGKQFESVRARGEYSHSTNEDIELSLSISVDIASETIVFTPSISNGESGEVSQEGIRQIIFYNDGTMKEEV